MTIIVHHLQRSASERIVWLLEELDVPYELKLYRRDPESLMAPAEYKALHPIGTAPIIQDGALTLSESSAIMEYILTAHCSLPQAQRLVVGAGAPNRVDYVYWLHWAIGSLQSDAMLACFVGWLSPSASSSSDNPVVATVHRRLTAGLTHLDARLRATPYLAGPAFTAADLYAVFSVTTMRLFAPFALEAYAGVRAWLARVAERRAYRAMVDKAERGEERGGAFPVMGAEAPAEPLRPAGV